MGCLGEPPEIASNLAPPVLSETDTFEFGFTMSPLHQDLFYGVEFEGERVEIWRRRWSGAWLSQPERVFWDAKATYHDPILSQDESRLYFTSDREGSAGSDLWVAVREGGGFASPTRLGPEINGPGDEYYTSLSSNGDLYFSSDRDGSFDIFVARRSGDAFLPAEALGSGVNGPGYEVDPFVAPDGSYLIFVSVRPDGLGRGDLYISRREGEGTWSPAKNLGARVNTDGHELCPWVWGDALFLSAAGDLRWVHKRVLD
ncbi:MAG: hypothetical protein AAF735_06715 [Myxococcota bacterium]